MLALHGQTPNVQVAVVNMPSEADPEAQRQLDAIAARPWRAPVCRVGTHAYAERRLSRTLISLAVADRRVIPIRA
jgi:hypothetical protein